MSVFSLNGSRFPSQGAEFLFLQLFLICSAVARDSNKAHFRNLAVTSCIFFSIFVETWFLDNFYVIWARILVLHNFFNDIGALGLRNLEGLFLAQYWNGCDINVFF